MFWGVYLAILSQALHKPYAGLWVACIALWLSWILELRAFDPSMWKRRFARHAVCALVVSLAYGAYAAPRLPTLPETAVVSRGRALLEPRQLQPTASFFAESWRVQGVIRTWEGEGGLSLHHLPCMLQLPRTSSRPILTTDVWIEGELEVSPDGMAYLRPLRGKVWQPVVGTHNGTERRFLAKQTVHHWLQEKIPDAQVSAFLGAFLTGEFSDPLLKVVFRRTGLVHILVVSGFHFSWLAAIVQRLLRWFLPQRIAVVTTVVALSVYFLFLGNSPPVLRAYLTALLATLGLLLRRRTSGMNLLGTALLLQLLLDPHALQHIGCQFSYLATAALVLLSPGCEQLLRHLLPSPPLPEVREISRAAQVFSLLIVTFRKALAINLAVHIALVPALILHFERAPLLGLLTNLYVPLGTLCLLALTLLGSVSLLFLPHLATLFFTATHWFGHRLLEHLQVLARFHQELSCSSLTPTLCLFWITALFAGRCSFIRLQLQFLLRFLLKMILRRLIRLSG